MNYKTHEGATWPARYPEQTGKTSSEEVFTKITPLSSEGYTHLKTVAFLYVILSSTPGAVSCKAHDSHNNSIVVAILTSRLGGFLPWIISPVMKTNL